MASTTTTLLVAVLLLASPAAMLAAGVCGGEKFPAGRSYATCADLPTLGATLHWTYDAKTALLSAAFVAKPAGANGAGWVSWAINPTGDEMKGSQALVAFKGAGGGAYAVNTYNVTGYGPLPAASTPIAFKATDLAADESGGKVRLYGKLQLPKGMKAVNYIWQVGSAVTNGAPAKHAFAKDNLQAKGKLVLAAGGAQEPAPAPALAPAAAGPSSGEASNATGTPSPSGGKSAAAGTYASAPVLMLLALAGLLVNI